MIREILAPRPEVQHLSTLFRRIENGEVRIPAFQRSYVWTAAQVVKLLESLYKGYPIGSLLFWRVEHEVLRIEDDPTIPFPVVEVRYPVSFVLDGMQRLSTLYGVFFWDRPDERSVFNVVFDLELEEFVHFDPDHLPRVYIPLSAVFSPKRLLETQRWLSEQPGSDEFIDRSVRLHSIFQEHMLPIVTITRPAVQEVVEIFERINSTGTKLNAVDFMRALTWSQEFDLNREIRRMRRSLGDLGFAFPAETLVKGLAVLLNHDPTAEDMLNLREHSPRELADGVVRAEAVFVAVIQFLQRDFRIYSPAFVPYEGQLLVLFKLFSANAAPDEHILSAARRWFWSTTLSEALRGKPDHYVARAIRAASSLAAGVVGALTHRLDLTPESLMERRFIRGKALSAGVAATFAAIGARSLTTGEVIDPQFYMNEFSGENFEGLYSLAAVQGAVKKGVSSSRTFANLILVTEAERNFLRNKAPEAIFSELLTRFDDTEMQLILRSQLIPPEAVAEALEGRAGLSLSHRAKAMHEHFVRVTSAPVAEMPGGQAHLGL